MEGTSDYCYQDPGGHISFACGGPIFVSNHVGPVTSVLDFKASVLQELQELEAEFSDLLDDFDEELLLDDLKFFTEEELVEKALEESEYVSVHDELLQSVEYDNYPSNGVVMNQQCVPDKEIDCLSSANGTGCLGSSVLFNNSSILACETDSKNKVQKKRSNKRGRLFDRNTRAAELESSYFVKAKQLAKIKQKQDEDKSAARLHSFSGSSKSVERAIVASEKIQKELLYNDSKSMEGAILTSEKIEKMQSLRSIDSSVKIKASTTQEHVPVCYPEVILCVEIYHQSNGSKKVQEFLVLGSQNLTELKDNIYCLTDKLMQTTNQDDSSGYFLIEDTFYNDLRSPSSSDYSRPIFDWLKKCSSEAAQKWEFIMSGELKRKQRELLGNLDISNLPNFRAVNMHEIRFSDLRFRLGAGYLYCHQGNCNHIIVIRDMRLIHPEDSQNRSDYPLLTFQVRLRQRKCSVCQIYQATKMTVDDRWAQENPCYFCIKCYFLLHYKEDSTLLYPHTVYDYYHE